MGTHKEHCSGLWRSEDMVRIDLLLPRDALHDTVMELGLLGKAQFIDLNEHETAFSRNFSQEIRQCEDIQRGLARIEEELVQDPSSTNAYKDFHMSASILDTRVAVINGSIDAITEHVESTISELGALLDSMFGLQSEINYNTELKRLYSRLQALLAIGGTVLDDRRTAADHLSPLTRMDNILGVVDAARAEDLRRLVYRVTRGNALVVISDELDLYPNPKAGGAAQLEKRTFAIFCSSHFVVLRLRKVASTIGATLYSLDEITDLAERLLETEGTLSTDRSGPRITGMTSSMHGSIPSAAVPADSILQSMGLGRSFSAHSSVSRTVDLQTTLNVVIQKKQDLLRKWYRDHRLYKTFIRMEKAVLVAMNQCRVSGSTCHASLWIPSKYEDEVERAMEVAVQSSGCGVESLLTHHFSQSNPPTFFETNKFTASFQGIVDSYGMARYKEVNPGVFTIITFPYLFGIMYGDIGHGFLLLLFSLYLILMERFWRVEQLNEIVGMLFGGRYLLLLMSLFAMYMGLLYNDFWGFPINLFSSGYTWAPMEDQHNTTYPLTPNGKPSVKPPHVYPVGLDVAWTETENKLEFYNSVKMKCAVIVGVVQMFAGLLLSLCNSIYDHNLHKILLLFVPEFVFLLCTFGYMSLLIVIKWCTTWENTNDAPSLLEVMTNFFLQPGTVVSPLFAGQETIQVILLLIAFAMVPVMLLGMPIVEYRRYLRWKRLMKEHAPNPIVAVLPAEPLGGDSHVSREEEVSTPTPTPSAADDGAMEVQAEQRAAAGGVDLGTIREEDSEEDRQFRNFDLSEMIIHYVIHTIEYVLSSVSNTASYLRLWALSLAHAQLAEVFLEFAVVKLLGMDSSGFFIAAGSVAWLVATLAVLVGMEALSSFLHALRLHWVEFQNKFYLGDGRPFEPLNLLSLPLH